MPKISKSPENAEQLKRLAAITGKKRGSKYRNVKTTVDGFPFDSKKEAERYSTLKLLKSAGVIEQLHLQRRFPIFVNDMLICEYVSDFDYFEQGRGHVTEDCKGFRTAVYKLKKKLMEAVHGIEIQEI